MPDRPNPARQHLALGTFSFAVCFAAWGLISAFAGVFREKFGLSATQTALLVAVPVLLGALARIPVGMLGDRLGGRAVLGVLMLIVAVPVYLVPAAGDFRTLLVAAFFLGLAGSAFSVGVGYVSRWTPKEQQGTALGVFGVGTIGQSFAVFLGPLLARRLGWPWVFRAVAVLLVVWGGCFLLLGRNAPSSGRPTGLGAMLGVLRREPLAWVLALFYFLTFGGFVAFSVYLPTLLRDQFGLDPADAGLRTAGFVALATGMRPLGGWLSDRIGGAQVLSGALLGIVPFSALLAWPSMVPFTVGTLGTAALLGMGNGAVFKLVPQYFPTETGTVTGLVGALGGLGGFFPPLVLGAFRDRIGVVWPGFLLLSATAFGQWLLNRRILLAAEERAAAASAPAPSRAAGELEHSARQGLEIPARWRRSAEQLRAGAWATLVSLLLGAAILVGSRRLQNFDPALVTYTFAVLFATWGVVYHYRVWLSKPPTTLYWRRSFELLLRGGLLRGLGRLARTSATHIFGQTFIYKRSPARWLMHQLLFWGCLLAATITFPLVFGWVHFTTRPDDMMVYVTHLFGFPVGSFRLGGPVAWVVFHGLDIAAVMVLGGIALALFRRMRERGAQALQTFGRDLFPLIILFAVSVTGLCLTVSTAFLRGAFYPFLSLLHAATVVLGLLYLPFGKFFHIFQRPAQLGVKLYQAVGDNDEGAHCRRCGQRYASRMHVADLKRVLPALGFDYRLRTPAPGPDGAPPAGPNGAPSPPTSDGRGPAEHWQDFCPTCKRRLLALSQLGLLAKERASRGQATSSR